MPAIRTGKRSAAHAALLLVCVALAAALPASPQTAPKSVLDLDGHAVDPFHLAGNKVAVFIFVRTDCPISNRYAPKIQELASRYNEHAAFFLVYPIASETPRQIRKHLQDYGYHLTALRDPELLLARASQVRITPEAAVFSADKKLLYHGRIDDWYVEFGRARREPTTHDLAATVECAVSGKPIPAATAPAVGCFIPGLT
jgi:thiol-disulfide isomerase/thioredoxin